MRTVHCNLRSGAGALLAWVVAAAACAGGRAGAAASRDSCQPVEGHNITSTTPWDSLPGGWRLTLVASAGPNAGRSVEGTMILAARHPSVRRMESPGNGTVTVPIIGSVDIALEQVGAVRLGNVRSTDSLQPGLAIWVSQDQEGRSSAVLRIGQEALRTDIVRFDGGYMALYLRQVSGEAIRGGWASGVRTEESSGWFCADR